MMKWPEQSKIWPTEWHESSRCALSKGT